MQFIVWPVHRTFARYLLSTTKQGDNALGIASVCLFACLGVLRAHYTPLDYTNVLAPRVAAYDNSLDNLPVFHQFYLTLNSDFGI